MKKSAILSGLIGVCVGDALGVPVEFTSRQERLKNPITTMTGYGTHRQPPGTWSDDSSLMLCLADSLCQGYNLKAIAASFCRWRYHQEWAAHGVIFDIGGTTNNAIKNLQNGVNPVEAGETDERSNGNGSLMRILPMAYLYSSVSFYQLIQWVHECSCLTHAHLRSQIACGIYISIAVKLLQGLDLKSAYIQGIEAIKPIYYHPSLTVESSRFDRVLRGNIDQLSIDEIQSGGYVIHTLEASLWCLLTTSSYSEAVLKAVNLGEDTDTTAAVTGGLAGIYYGLNNIPSEWVEQIARKDDIIALANRLEQTLE
ncbi:MAG TPA: ADP-ribosylglycohydrolase family protein [Candidatus Obscuribacterales bacterium]